MGDHDDPGPVPPLKARLLGVLLDPRALFARHDGSWGWLGPWLLVSLAGFLFGVVFLTRIDLDAQLRAESEAAFERMDAATRRKLDDPKAQEAMAMVERFTAFAAKGALVAGPPVGNLVGMLVAGALLFGASRLGGERPDLMRSISVAAHAQLVNLVGIGASALAVLTGNGHAMTSPANLVDKFAHPVAYAALTRLDPVTLLYYAVIAAALEASLRVPRRRAVALSFGTYLVLSLLWVALSALGAAMQTMGGGGA